jgi:hypothetical protein
MLAPPLEHSLALTIQLHEEHEGGKRVMCRQDGTRLGSQYHPIKMIVGRVVLRLCAGGTRQKRGPLTITEQSRLREYRLRSRSIENARSTPTRGCRMQHAPASKIIALASRLGTTVRT